MFVEIVSDENGSAQPPIQNLEAELARLQPPVQLRPLQVGYDWRRYASAGLFQGALAGCTSLLANVIGSVLSPPSGAAAQHPLHLIQIYLTFPLGAQALGLEGGRLLGLGALLYLATGMLYGMLFVLILSYFLPQAGLRGRLAACTLLACLVWVTNFYGLLAWLQPVLFGGRWIVDLVPWWVAAATHLLFGWTIALLYPLGTQDVRPLAQESA